MMFLRIASLAVAASLAGAALAAPLALKTEVAVAGDVVTLADLVEGVTGPKAATPLFRAPALGESGTIQARRVSDAVARLGLGRVETRGQREVRVERAARMLGRPEIEAALKAALAETQALDMAAHAIVFDEAPSLAVPAEVAAPASVEDLAFDRRTRRVSASVRVGADAEGGRSLKVAGLVVETIGVAVLTRSISRGDTVSAADIVIERRQREQVPGDAAGDAELVAGQVARRALSAGTMLRNADLFRPELVARGEPVLIVYEAPGLMLTLRGKANEAGAKGDIVSVQNLQSKKILQGTVTGPGTVTVRTGFPGRVAATSP